jgi:hypothetical protein
MIKKIEEVSINAWPSLQTNIYDRWIIRFAKGYTKRANSINPLYHLGVEVDKKIDYCEMLLNGTMNNNYFKLIDNNSIIACCLGAQEDKYF